MGTIRTNFWKDKRIFLTGHTGFKGSWLSLWLSHLGAKVTGYALPPATTPNLFECANIQQCLEKHIIGDIRSAKDLNRALTRARPQIVVHMAAQPIVLESYKNPVETFSINIMGTVNVLEAVRNCKGIKAVINVTSDKCYENKERLHECREGEPLGGVDPYSSSKACSELVTAAYRNSFFNQKHAASIASARSGNVIGGGDWAPYRLVPDCIRSFLDKKAFVIRNPDAIRPWQHVFEALYGYLLLAEKLYCEGPKYAEAWNFGPKKADAKSAKWVAERLCDKLGPAIFFIIENRPQPHEASSLVLNSSKARKTLGWKPRWNLDQALDKIVEWAKGFEKGQDCKELCLAQIDNYMSG
jgi:CDP-glucose 4,6-dehydratase